MIVGAEPDGRSPTGAALVVPLFIKQNTGRAFILSVLLADAADGEHSENFERLR